MQPNRCGCSWPPKNKYDYYVIWDASLITDLYHRHSITIKKQGKVTRMPSPWVLKLARCFSGLSNFLGRPFPPVKYFSSCSTNLAALRAHSRITICETLSGIFTPPTIKWKVISQLQITSQFHLQNKSQLTLRHKKGQTLQGLPYRAWWANTKYKIKQLKRNTTKKSA